MDDETLTSVMSDPQGFENLMEQHYGAVLREFDHMDNLMRLLRGRNTSLTDEMKRHNREENDLKSTFAEIKARLLNAQQMLGQPNTNRIVARAGATGGRRGNGSVYHEIMDFLKNLSQEVIVLNEQLRRKGELLAEAKRDAAESATRYQKVTSDLMTKLNSLQTRKETLYDDQCVSEWHRIQQALDSWTRRTFKDKSAMSRMTVETLQNKSSPVTLQKEYLQDIHTKRAYVQCVISGTIFEAFLKPLFVFIPDTWTEQFLNGLGEAVSRSGSSYDWETWRSSTSKALENRFSFGNNRLDQAWYSLICTVESTFGDFYSPKVSIMNASEGLKKVFDDCLAFKAALERQESDYVFRQSPPGTVYSAEKMKSLNYNEEEGSTVVMSVWPSVYKVSFDNDELLLELEAVWTKGPDQVDNSAMEHQSDVEKEIKQEVKTEGDNEEMSLIGL